MMHYGTDYPEPALDDPFADEDTPPDLGGWVPQPLDAAALAAGHPPAATVLPVQGVRGLFYPGRVHTIYGEPGSGKSWLLVAAITAALRADPAAVCLLLDFEDAPNLWAARFRQTGVPADELRRITYLAPRDPMPTLDTLDRLTEHPWAVTALDGLTSFYQLHGQDLDSGTDTARVFGWLERLTSSGAAVIASDHVTKSKDGRRFALGSGHKLAAVTGAAYRVDADPDTPIRRHGAGLSTVTLTKDRAGGIPCRANGQAAVMTLDDRKGAPSPLRVRPGEAWS
jgi:hypothetical protein